VLAEIDRIAPDGVARVAGEFFRPDRHTAVWLGPN